VAVLIPSIDLMGGKIVQLVQGEQMALESSDFDYWIDRFSRYPLVQLIDLDAAKGVGSNHQLIAMMCRRIPCQAGGGIRTVARAKELLALGAKRVILGSALIREGAVNTEFAAECRAALGGDHLTFAVDSRGGHVAIHGWQQDAGIEPRTMMQALEPYCNAFLYTHIETEGTLLGFPLELARDLRNATARRLIVAGGIRSLQEIEVLETMGVDAVVGMAMYVGAIGE
jgi:phosphoribosylformimino-5-aminoimidazole carboxamide ribotide isomerase